MSSVTTALLSLMTMSSCGHRAGPPWGKSLQKSSKQGVRTDLSLKTDPNIGKELPIITLSGVVEVNFLQRRNVRCEIQYLRFRGVGRGRTVTVTGRRTVRMQFSCAWARSGLIQQPMRILQDIPHQIHVHTAPTPPPATTHAAAAANN